MKIKFLAIASAVLLSMGFALTAGAGSVADADSDLVPDAFDNCSATANGPGDLSNQVDVDSDGNGDVCDCDFVGGGSPGVGDGNVLGDDIAALFVAFNTPSTEFDTTGDAVVLGDDVANCFGRFNLPVGD